MVAICVLLALCGSLQAKKKGPAGPPPHSVTVPAVIDHNRVIINADISLPDGSTQTIRAWVDNGNPDLYLSRRVATVLGLNVSCGDKECSAPPPEKITIGGMAIPLGDVKQAKIPLRPVSAAAVLALGMNAEINLPSTVLRPYDVLVDFPERKFTIGGPGSIHFQGVQSKVEVNAENGLIQVPSKIENKKYNLALDLGACISFLSEDVFDSLAAANKDWPRMTGAIGAANMWGAPEEVKWNVMRLGRLQFGPLFLTNVPVVALPKTVMDFLEKRAGVPTEGLVASEALQNYRVGLDYAHSMVYFDIGRLATLPDFDVVGLILRPEDNGNYTILAVADFDGKPSVDGVQAGDRLVAVNNIAVTGATMGQVWSALGGTLGQERKLTMERAGKQFDVMATVRHFLEN
jgi:hypothetical protein